jgi:L-ascorbate metabolism protein UlaG (beta-lactamase superfamily)
VNAQQASGYGVPMTTPTLQFIGNATVLLRFGELTLLTDPNFLHRGQRAYLGHGLVSKRLTEPALDVSDLPDLSAVLLSHLHGDHWDRVAQKGLDHDVPIVTTPHASRRLQWRGFPRATGLRTWASTEVAEGDSVVRITSMPGRHAPLLFRRLLPPVMGSMLEFRTGTGPVSHRLYVTGDTLMVEELREIPRRYPEIHTTVLHLGGTTLPGGLMVTMDAAQGADLLDLVSPSHGVPVHHSDYTVFASPLADFRDELARRGTGHRVTVVEPGQTIDLTQRGDERGQS